MLHLLVWWVYCVDLCCLWWCVIVTSSVSSRISINSVSGSFGVCVDVGGVGYLPIGFHLWHHPSLHAVKRAFTVLFD